jgi:hypothetical protein
MTTQRRYLVKRQLGGRWVYYAGVSAGLGAPRWDVTRSYAWLFRDRWDAESVAREHNAEVETIRRRP